MAEEINGLNSSQSRWLETRQDKLRLSPALNSSPQFSQALHDYEGEFSPSEASLQIEFEPNNSLEQNEYNELKASVTRFPSTVPSNKILIIHSFLLLSVYTLYAFLQEWVMRSRYGSANESLTSANLIILFNRLTAVFLGVLILLVRTPFTSKSLQPQPSLLSRLLPSHSLALYAAIAACHYVATFAQFQSREFHLLNI